MNPTSYLTPFELASDHLAGNTTTTFGECIAFYERLAKDYPRAMKWFQIGESDGGWPIHAGVVTTDGEFNLPKLKAQKRLIFFNNNGIHPGEPEGIDACMALVRDFCVDENKRASLGNTVFLFIPIYNVDGCNSRNSSSRVNQLGPQSFGFRANALNLDLNRDFVKCDSLSAQAFNRFFTAWSPDVMVDTHTSNGADYAYTMTIIATQSDKLGGELGEFMRAGFLPAIYSEMQTRGWPSCPYVNPVHETPDDGIEDFIEVPRFSTGYAALHHTIGFMPETHMLKPFADRYASTRAFVETVLYQSIQHGDRIQALRAKAREEVATKQKHPIHWEIDRSRPSRLEFHGYEAVREPSLIGDYQRLRYDRSKPWVKEIDYFNRATVTVEVEAPAAYVIPQAWRVAVERLQWNGLALTSLEAPTQVTAQVYRVKHTRTTTAAYEGHAFHRDFELETVEEAVTLNKGDWLLRLDESNRHAARYAIETLEPLAHDSFFRWGFFNSILERKENYSDYVFEDVAANMLADEPKLRDAFEQWKREYPALVSDKTAVLNFIFEHGERHRESAWKRYPVLRICSPGVL
jgi:hypothetical protein